MEAAAKRGNAVAQQELKALARGPLGYVWDWFLELHQRRGVGAMGPAPITWPDLDAWCRRTGRNPAAWELDVIAVLDNAFFASVTPPKDGK